jgi:hypothetical protein
MGGKRKGHNNRLETAVKIGGLVIVAVELARFILDYIIK